MKDEGSRQEGRISGRAIWPWILVLVCFLAVSALHGSKGNACGSLETSILRFHVLANSDSEEDQNVKKKVRHAVRANKEPYLLESENIHETRATVNDHMDELIAVSTETLAAHGLNYCAFG